MGTKVQLDNYYSMRDLNHDSNGTSWPSCGENNLPNGQYYYGVMPSSSPDSYLGADKNLLKRKMLEHETVFQNQVSELHRVYRVQRDLMDEYRKKEEFRHRTPCEASSSSSPLASQTKPEDAHRRNSSSFLFSNSICGAGGFQNGKSVQEGGPALFQNCASPRTSEVSESRPTKLRKVIDLQFPPEVYLDAEDSHHCENSKYEEVASKSSDCLRKPNTLADLNEPPDTEEPIASSSVDFLTKVPCPADGILWKSNHGNIYGTQNNSRRNDKVSQEGWFSSGLKPGLTNDSEKFINQSNHPEKESLHSRSLQVVFENPHQPYGMFPRHHLREDWPVKATDGFTVFDKSCFSNFNDSGRIARSSVNTWDPSHGKQSSFLSQKPISAQTNPFLGSASLSKSSQSPIQSDYPGSWLHKNNGPILNPGYGTKAPVRNGFYHGTSSDGYKELSVSFPNASLNHVNATYNDKAASGSCDFLQGRNSIDLNSTRDLNLNVAIPNGLSDESVVPQWLRGKISNQAVSSRNAVDHDDAAASASCNVAAMKGKSHVIIDHPSSSNLIFGIPIHQVPVSGEQEINSTKKKLLFDMNMPCDDLEELVEDDKVETKCSNSVRQMIDLNSCFAEDEIPSSPITNDMKRPKGCIIDLEAPIDPEDDESTDSSAEILARGAAEAIITLSSSVPEDRVNEASEDDALRWFVDIVCGCPNADDMDCTSSESDYLEEMTLKLTECTVNEYFPDPPNFEIPALEETGAGIVTGRARRGPARRGRQKRDFQRDILPGLTSLARNEVTEDLQTFGGLMRATGHAWDCGSRRNSSRNGSKRGRGRRKAVATIPPSPPSAMASPAVTDTIAPASYQKLFPKNGEATVVEDRSLGSWGKTTRRPRRQRCPPDGRKGTDM